MEITASSVEKTVQEFYRSGGSTNDCHEWLTMAQLSHSAWNFSWELVSADKPHEVQFFGASSLAIKVSRCWFEVPSEHYEDLRKRLLTLVLNYRGPKIVVTRLCVAIAGVVIQSVPNHWSNPIQDLILGFQSHFSQDNMYSLGLLLELLTVIPEEFGTLVMAAANRTVVRCELTKALSHIIPLIEQVLNGTNMPSDVPMQAIKCFQSWVQFGVPLDEITGLIQKILNSVNDEELFDCSLDALSSIISHPDTHKYPNTLKNLFESLLPLDQMLYGFMTEGSFEMATPLVSLFITFGECHSRLLLDWSTSSEKGQQSTLRFINVILNVSSTPAQYPTQETLSEMVFGFWYIFQDDIIACAPSQLQQCLSIYGPIYRNLVDALLKKSMYRLDEDKWTADQRENFRCYRTDIGDTIMYCFNILKEDLLKQLLQHLEDSISQNLTNPSEHWPYLEATLYAWSSIAESMAEEEEVPLLTSFLAKLPVIPYHNNKRVVSTALDCIGGFAEWLAMHPQLLPRITPLVTTALQSPELAMCATMALKDMSRDCSEGMRPYAEEIIAACVNSFHSNQLASGECIRLMYPIGKMLSLLPYETLLVGLESIVSPHLSQLQLLTSETPNQQNRLKIIFYLKLFMSLFTTLNIRKEDDRAEAQQSLSHPQPILRILPQLLSLLSDITTKWGKDSEVMESECNLLKQTVSTLLDEVKPFVKDIINITLSCYTTHPTGAALDLSRQFFVMFGKEIEYQVLLHRYLNDLCIRTFSEIGTFNLSEHSDLISSFFQTLTQVIRKQTSLLVSNENLSVVSLFDFAVACLAMPEVGPVKYSSQFLSHYILVSRDFPHMTNSVNSSGEKLFMQTINCIGGEAARSFTDYYAEILLSLNKKYFDNLCQWLNLLISAENFPSRQITRQQKELFARSILRERTNKRKILEIIREFSLACCGLIGTEYAAHMGQVMAAWDTAEERQNEKIQQQQQQQQHHQQQQQQHQRKDSVL